MILWSSKVDVSVLSFSKSHIHVQIGNGSNGVPWQFTRFYGNPETSKRNESWQLLKVLKEQFKLPWLRAGDFNEILFEDEKIGVTCVLQVKLSSFREIVDACIFHEFPTI